MSSHFITPHSFCTIRSNLGFFTVCETSQSSSMVYFVPWADIITCEKCKETKEYKQHLLHFELAYDCNAKNWIKDALAGFLNNI